MDQHIDMYHGWVNHVRYGNTIGLREALFAQHPIQARRRNHLKDQEQ